MPNFPTFKASTVLNVAWSTVEPVGILMFLYLLHGIVSPIPLITPSLRALIVFILCIIRSILLLIYPILLELLYIRLNP